MRKKITMTFAINTIVCTHEGTSLRIAINVIVNFSERCYTFQRDLCILGNNLSDAVNGLHVLTCDC